MLERVGWAPVVGVVTLVACGGQTTPPDDPKASPSSTASSSASAAPSALAEKEALAALFAELEGDDEPSSDDGTDADDGKKKKRTTKKDKGKAKKKKKKKKKKVPTSSERTERHCASSCARSVRCMDEGDVDEDTLADCQRECRRADGRKIDRLRNAFVFLYASCLDGLDCDDPEETCRDRVVAKVLKVDEDSREDYLACEARRKACGLGTDRCRAHAWSNPGIRRAMNDCLGGPCGRLRQCLQDATWR